MAAWPICRARAQGVFLHLVQGFPFPGRFSNRCLQLLRQLDQRFALDFVLRIDHAHGAASMPG